VRATNTAGTKDSGSATVTVTVNQPAAIATTPASITINSGATTTLSVVASGTAPFTYQWYQGAPGVTTTPVGTDSASLLTPALTATTSYWVKVTNAANTTGANSAAATVTVAASAPFVAWQNSQFSSVQLADPLVSGATADPDGDGITNACEHIFGLSPLVSTPAPSPTLALSSGQFSVNFTATLASGSGYAGVARHYALQSTDSLGTGGTSSWTDVSGYSDIVGNNQGVSYSTAATARKFYRLLVWLAP